MPKKSSKPLNIIVVGVPRSGTSLTSAIFTRRGYHIGYIEEQHMRVGDEGNPFGYFEADDVISRNVEVFNRAGFPGHNTWLHDIIPDECIANIASLAPSAEHRAFVEAYNRRAPWLWKDPRLCLTLPYWWKLMDARTTGVILLRRSIAASVSSFERLGWIGSSEKERREVRGRIQRHLRAAEEAIQSLRIPHIEIDYADYLKTPRQVNKRLSDFVGIEFSENDLNVRQELNHGSLRGRFTNWLKQAPSLKHMRRLRPLVPEPLLEALFPEKKYARGTHPQGLEMKVQPTD